MDYIYIIRYAFGWLIQIIEFLILIRVILSWLPLDRSNVIISAIYTLTEPILGPIRNLLFKSPLGGSGMMLDFSPLIAFIILRIISNLILY